MDDEKDLQQQQQQQSGNKASDIADAAKQAHKMAKNSRAAQNAKTAQNAAKAASNAGKAASMAGKLVTFLWWVAFIIVVIIMVIGIVTFVLSGLGLIWGGISSVVEHVADWWTSITQGAEYIVHPDDVENVMNYLHNMDYDLYGYGFVTNPADSGNGWTIDGANSSNDKLEEVSGSVKINEGNYKTRTKGEENSSDPTYNTFRYLQTYMVADNYSSLLKNGNKNASAAISGGNNDETFLRGVKDFFKGLVADDIEWGTGLISVYYEDEGDASNGKITGKRGKSVEGESVLLKVIPGFNFVQAVDTYLGAHARINDRKLVISSGENSNIKFKYDLDGWIGRYGMPLEFLLSVHLATMAPDLSYKIATSFDTDVQVLVHESKDSDVKSGVVLKNKDNIKRTSMLAEFSKLSDEEKEYFLLPNVKPDGDTAHITKDEYVAAHGEVDVEPIVTKDDIAEIIDDDTKKVSEKISNTLWGLSPKDVMLVFNQTPLTSAPGCVGPHGKYEENDVWVPVDVVRDIDNVAGVDRNNILEENHYLDKVSNVRQTIEFEIYRLLDEIYEDNDFIDKNNPFVEEISLEQLKKKATGEYNESQAGKIEGTTTNYYEFQDLDTGRTNGDFIKPYTETPFTNEMAQKAGDVINTDAENPSLQGYLKNMIYNDMQSQDLIWLSESEEEGNNGYEIKKIVDEEGSPSLCGREQKTKYIKNRYDNAYPQIDRFFSYWNLYRETGQTLDSNFGGVAEDVWYEEDSWAARDWYVFVLWNSDLYGKKGATKVGAGEDDIVITDNVVEGGVPDDIRKKL